MSSLIYRYILQFIISYLSLNHLAKVLQYKKANVRDFGREFVPKGKSTMQNTTVDRCHILWPPGGQNIQRGSQYWPQQVNSRIITAINTYTVNI